MSPLRAFTREFKVEAVSRVTQQGLSVAAAARRLEIGQNLLRKWREQLAAEGSRAFAAKSPPSALEEENRRLLASTIHRQPPFDKLDDAQYDNLQSQKHSELN